MTVVYNADSYRDQYITLSLPGTAVVGSVMYSSLHSICILLLMILTFNEHQNRLQFCCWYVVSQLAGRLLRRYFSCTSRHAAAHY